MGDLAPSLLATLPPYISGHAHKHGVEQCSSGGSVELAQRAFLLPYLLTTSPCTKFACAGEGYYCVHFPHVPQWGTLGKDTILFSPLISPQAAEWHRWRQRESCHVWLSRVFCGSRRSSVPRLIYTSCVGIGRQPGTCCYVWGKKSGCVQALFRAASPFSLFWFHCQALRRRDQKNLHAHD